MLEPPQDEVEPCAGFENNQTFALISYQKLIPRAACNNAMLLL